MLSTNAHGRWFRTILAFFSTGK